MRRLHHLDLDLLLQWKRKEALCHRDDIGNQLGIDPMSREVKETVVMQCLAQTAGEGIPLGLRAVKTGKIESGKLGRVGG